MNLPYLDNIIIEDRKLSDYLLNINHPDGNWKAKFLIARGFNKESLRIALITQAKEIEVMNQKYLNLEQNILLKVKS